ncbi:MAG: hypothetical protein JNL84_09070 [Candidatus Accumulibacter sp.]|nr:hypothetical protein [Accumulibacter sp.]
MVKYLSLISYHVSFSTVVQMAPGIAVAEEESKIKGKVVANATCDFRLRRAVVNRCSGDYESFLKQPLNDSVCTPSSLHQAMIARNL